MPDRKLKVFLSSTAQDLTAFRKAVHARLAASPLFECIRQEDFGAQPHPAPALCKAEVERSDLFVGLIGMRRGWEPPDDNPDKRSITEMEYEWAKDVAPRFMHVAPTNFPVPGDMRESPEEHDRQLAFRTRVMSELVVSQDGFVSADGLSTPHALARTVVDQLTKHVLESDELIHRIRPKPRTAPEDQTDAIADRLLKRLDKEGFIKKAEQGGLEREVVLKLAKRLKPDETLDFDRAVAELENAITIAVEAIERGRRGSNEDEFVSGILKEIATHTKAGEPERAIQTLEDALKELDTRDIEYRETLKRSRVTLLRAALEQDILRRDALSAAQRVQRIVAIETLDDDEAQFDALRKKQDEYDVEGRDKGLNFSLEIAIEISRLCVAAARTPDQLGAAFNDLGIALKELGERESGTTRLDDAVAAFRGALNEYTRERTPNEWAAVQNNLGATLQTLGERESGTARLDEAVTAFREALKERTRERAPLRWAMTQNNLGTVLQRLGERESGTARLDEAVTAYREALKERTREFVPREWATTQMNLAAALTKLGQRERNVARLEEAIAVLREALKERTRALMPLSWATTQNNLGIALEALGTLESGTARLEEAVTAYGEALKERTPERAPLDWAATLTNLGGALTTLDKREGGTARLDKAIAAYREALMVFGAGKATYYLEVAKRGLARTEALLAERNPPRE